MKNKKLPIIIGVVLGVLIIAGLILFLTLRAKKITVTFLDETTTVSELKVKKGETITLPTVRKDGYDFEGWYYENTKLENGVWFDHDVVINARWLKMNAPTMTITYDTDGGVLLESTTIECNTALNLPTPTKEGYKFLNWQDQNEILISNETKLACEDITLKAKWEKVEVKKTEEKKPETKPTETKKEYTCPEEYTLDGTKCTIEGTVREKCGERGFEYNGKCVTITGSARKEGERGCPKKFITYKSYASDTAGEMVYAGTYFCYYYKVSAADQTSCTSQSGQYGAFVWRQSNSSCYVTMTTASMTCDNLSGYVYIADPNTYSGVNGLNGGCYPLSDKTRYCDDGYTLTNNKCVKTIDATLK